MMQSSAQSLCSAYGPVSPCPWRSAVKQGEYKEDCLVTSLPSQQTAQYVLKLAFDSVQSCFYIQATTQVTALTCALKKQMTPMLLLGTPLSLSCLIACATRNLSVCLCTLQNLDALRQVSCVLALKFGTHLHLLALH